MTALTFMVARNPDPDSRLPYLIRLPIRVVSIETVIEKRDLAVHALYTRGVRQFCGLRRLFVL